METHKVIIRDTRNQKDDFVVRELERLGYIVIANKLPFGDFALPTNLLCAVDIKSSGGGALELSKNVCSKDHNRLRREINLCASVGGQICFLCCEPGVNSIDDLAAWESPCYKSGKNRGKPFTRVKGETLAKALKTMSEPNHYAEGLTVRFAFAPRAQSAEKIVTILNYYKEVT